MRGCCTRHAIGGLLTPRGCYAKTQRIHYDFNCAPRYTVMTERVSMDLNGTIVKHEVLEAAPRYTPAFGVGAL